MQHLEQLNPAQREAVTAGAEPLLVIAGAGSGKTKTLAHRVAEHILQGVDPRRILLLTFSRRAADEMVRRAQRIVQAVKKAPAELAWAGTFHAVAHRLLRLHARELALDPAFTVLDRADAEDLLDLARDELALHGKDKRFPRKATCLAIYSRTVNGVEALAEVLKEQFPWCATWEAELKQLFRLYVQQKQAQSVLDYDDLLLYWAHLMAEPALAAQVRTRFDRVLVDEYQDTNPLQARILRGLAPDGQGLTVVGDDAQAIYGFRAASVRNILDFPMQFAQPARVVKLEQNYRSTQPILEAANAVISLAPERYAKELFSTRASPQRPLLVVAEDEAMQVDYVVGQLLAQREAGVPLQEQAVLFRAAHHSDALELELSRRNIPFVKFGGLKFLEAAHVKDLLAVLRWVENPRDQVAGFRVLQLLPGVGPAVARRATQFVVESGHALRALANFIAPGPARADWPKLCELLLQLANHPWPGQLGAVRAWYAPHLERLHDDAHVRAADLEQLEVLSAGFASRAQFLADLTLDPPQATGTEAGPPSLDEEYLILSTIHSAKGQEWQSVFVLNVVDGCIPSDMAAGSAEELEEERRLLYVAMTRAKDSLHLVQPLKFHVRQQARHGDRHVYAPRSRFLPDGLLQRFEQRVHARPRVVDASGAPAASIDVGARLRAMWD